MIIYHNPRCRKSRETLALIEEAGVTPEVHLYLNAPLGVARLRELCELLGKSPLEITRTKEAVFKELGLSKESSDEVLLEAMAAHPKLMERPIVVEGQRAVLGRPPQNVKELL